MTGLMLFLSKTVSGEDFFIPLHIQIFVFEDLLPCRCTTVGIVHLAIMIHSHIIIFQNVTDMSKDLLWLNLDDWARTF